MERGEEEKLGTIENIWKKGDNQEDSVTLPMCLMTSTADHITGCIKPKGNNQNQVHEAGFLRYPEARIHIAVAEATVDYTVGKQALLRRKHMEEGGNKWPGKGMSEEGEVCQ